MLSCKLDKLQFDFMIKEKAINVDAWNAILCHLPETTASGFTTKFNHPRTVVFTPMLDSQGFTVVDIAIEKRAHDSE